MTKFKKGDKILYESGGDYPRIDGEIGVIEEVDNKGSFVGALAYRINFQNHKAIWTITKEYNIHLQGVKTLIKDFLKAIMLIIII